MVVWVGDERPWEPSGMTTELWSEVPLTQVPMEGLRLTQSQLSIPALLSVAAGGPSWCGDPYPHVVVWDGYRWVSDGHHRVLIAWLRGAHVVTARLLDLDAGS